MNIRLHANDIGELAVEESAIRSIVELAIKDVGDGSGRVNRHLLFGNPIHVKEGPEKKLLIELELMAPYGVFIPDAVHEIQDGIKKALASTLAVENVAINVVVATVTANPPDGESNGLSEFMSRGMQGAKDLVDSGLKGGKDLVESGLKPIKEKAAKVDTETAKA